MFGREGKPPAPNRLRSAPPLAPIPDPAQAAAGFELEAAGWPREELQAGSFKWGAAGWPRARDGWLGPPRARRMPQCIAAAHAYSCCPVVDRRLVMCMPQRDRRCSCTMPEADARWLICLPRETDVCVNRTCPIYPCPFYVRHSHVPLYLWFVPTAYLHNSHPCLASMPYIRVSY